MLYVLSQFPRTVYKNEPFAALEASEQPLMILGVLPDPGVTVIDIDCRDVVISKARKNNKPLGEKVRFKAIARPSMCKVHYNFIWLCIIWLQGQQDMVYQQITIDLTSFESKGDDKKKDID